MKILVVLATVLVVAFGCLGIAFGQADDSPGFGGLSMFVVLAGLFLGWRALRQTA